MPRTRQKLEGEARFEIRNRPKQQRAKSTVVSIKESALELLATEGFSACGTDRIAANAGTSIGTLYKYFPNREAILRSLYEDASIEYARTVGNLTLQILELPTEAGMELTMRSVVAMLEKNHVVLLKLVNEAPELKLESQPMAFHNLVRANIRAYVQHRNLSLKPQEIAHRCFFIERIVFSSMQGYVSDPPSGMTNKKFSRGLAHIVANIIGESA